MCVEYFNHRRFEEDYSLKVPDDEICLPMGNEITADVQYVFTNGQCHGLAVALHELTGWPLFGLYRLPSYGWWDNRSKVTTHVVVEHPTGAVVDINGLRPVRFGEGMRPTTANALLGGPKKDWLKPNMVLARHFAQIVIRNIEGRSKKRKKEKSQKNS